MWDKYTYEKEDKLTMIGEPKYFMSNQGYPEAAKMGGVTLDPTPVKGHPCVQ